MRTTPTRLRWMGERSMLLSLLSVLALLAFLSSADHAGAATSFNPTGDACLDNEATADPEPFKPGNTGECDGDSAPGATSGTTTGFNLASGDVNFAAVIGFTPQEWGIPAGDTITDGAVVGTLSSQATLGLIGGACNTSLGVSFTLLDATTSSADTVTFDNGFKDADGDKLPDAVTKYPDFLTRIFAGVTPRARLYGQTSVAGIPVSIGFLLFEPGTQIGALTPDPKLGYPSVTVLQNTGDPDAVPAPNAITDFCSPLLASTMINGITQDNQATATNEGGQVFRSNPSAAGTYNFVTFAAGQRDADGDGFENGLDLCPLTPDPDWDPRSGVASTAQPGDADGDRIPDSCDKEPNSSPPSSDVDNDAYMNSGDNCPQDANGVAGSNQKDSDGDGIGDECDTGGQGPNTADGDVKTVCVVNQVQVGGGGTPAFDPMTLAPCVGTASSQQQSATTTTTTTTTTAGGTAATTSGGAAGAPASGVGSLTPGGSSGIPLWAAVAAGLGGVGILGSLGAVGSRVLAGRRRRG